MHSELFNFACKKFPVMQASVICLDELRHAEFGIGLQAGESQLVVDGVSCSSQELI